MADITVLFIFVVLMLPGLLGIVLPILPGVPYMMVVALTYGLVTHFHTLSGTPLYILGGIALVSLVIDYYSGIAGARIGGASKQSVQAGFIGMIIGTVLFPPFGGLAGLAAGVLIMEAIRSKDRSRAVRAAAGSILGVMAGSCINGALGILFIILFVTFSI